MNAFLLILSPTSYSPIPSDIRIDVVHNAKLHYFLISTKKIEEKLKEAKKNTNSNMPFLGERNAVSLTVTCRFALRESVAGLKPEERDFRKKDT